MSRRKIQGGSTSVMVPIFVQDTSSTTGAGLGSLVFNTSGLAAKYRREGDSSWTSISLVTATAGTFTSGGFVSDGGPVTGGYEVGVPNAALAAGVRWAQVAYYGATNMLPVLLEFELDTINYEVANGKLPVTLASTDVTGNVAADVQTIKTQAVTCPAGVTVGAFVGNASAALQVDGSGYVKLSNGTGTGQISLTSGVVSANAVQINAVSTSGVTTINPNVGTTQPVNFNGTGGSAYVMVDVIQSAGVTVTNFDGTASAGGTNTITLDSSTASTVAGTYNRRKIYINGGTGNGQANVITTYAGSPSYVATCLHNWVTQPDNTSTYLIGQTADADVQLWLDSAPNALISGRLDVNTQATGSALTFNLTGSVSGSVGSVTGNVGGNVLGSVASCTVVNGLANNVITAGSIASSAQALIATLPWDQTTSGHTTSGSFGAAVVAAGSAGDPWATLLPGSYGAGTAGSIVGNNLNATVGSRATVTGIWQDTNAGDFTVANSIGKSLFTGVVPGGSGGIALVGSNMGSVTNVTGSVTGSVGSVVSAVTVGTNNDKGGYALAATGLNSVLIAGVTLPNAIKYIGATTAGKLPSGAGSGQENWLDFSGAAAVDITVDSSGNRTLIVYH